MRYAAILELLIFICCVSRGQQNLSYSFRHITQQDGLLHNQVLAVTQDAKGFIWIATYNGLQRYDGLDFVYYPNIFSSSEQVSNSAEMHVDKETNQLWINNYYSLEKFDLSNNKITVYSEKDFEHKPAVDYDVYKGANGEEWFIGNHAVSYYNRETKKLMTYYFNSFPPNAHRTACQATDSSQNTTWFIADGKLLAAHKKYKTVSSQEFNAEHHPLLEPSVFKNKEYVRYVMVDRKQNIWVTTWGDGLYRYDDDTKRVTHFSLDLIKKGQNEFKPPTIKPLVTCMIEDDHQNTWIGTEGLGLIRYNDDTGKFDYCLASEKSTDGIQYDYKLFDLFQDKEENIWVCTDKGISIFNPYRPGFSVIRHEEDNKASISKTEITSFIQATNGDLYFGTWGGGIAIYDSLMKFKKNIMFKGAWQKNFVWSLLQVNDKTLWIGCQHGYLLVYDIVTGNIQTLQPPEMKGSTIKCMEKASNGDIVVGLYDGSIVKWDKQKDKFLAGEPLPGPLKREAVNAIHIDEKQNCWVTTEAGFKKFDLAKMAYTNVWLPGKNNRTTISALICNGVTSYDDSTLLIGTIHGGLNFFHKTSKTFSHITIDDGLPSNSVFALKKDSKGQVWFTTDYGLYRFNPNNKPFVFQAKGPGRLNTSFAANTIYPLRNGQWLTFTTSEAISFFPQQKLNGERLKTEITGFSIFAKPVAVDSLLAKNSTVHLSYTQNFFSVGFGVLSFTDPGQIRYSYRLLGVDKDWVTSGVNRFASYTDLKPGKYRFEVKADKGDTAGEITSVDIQISPPFWKTTGFIIAISVCLLLLSYRFIKWREKNIKAIVTEKLKVQQLNADKLKNKLELEQITSYFSTSLVDKGTVDEVVRDVAKNLIGRLGFVDCTIYLWNDDKTKMIQKAGFGLGEISDTPCEPIPDEEVVRFVTTTGQSLIIEDTSVHPHTRSPQIGGLSEITVPVVYNKSVVGIIDSKHHQKDFFKPHHLQILNTIATLMANKILSIEAEQALRQTQLDMFSINEQLFHTKLEALRSQMNPHFIFNCINSIDALIQSNDKYHATVYLNKFAKLLRNILDGSRQNTVTFHKDIEALKLYVELEQLRYENKFTSHFNIDPALLNGDYKVPSLVIQPFVENAILHGLKNKKGNEGILTIDIQKENGGIRYCVTDNGIGRKAASIFMQNKESHYGLQISNERIKLFNSEEKASVEIEDLYEDKKASGTRVTINLTIS